MASKRALAKALIRANSTQALTAGPGGFGGAPPSTMGPSPLVASYGEWAGGRVYDTSRHMLPREWEAFLSGSFGPLAPMQPIAIDSPASDTEGPEPRRFTYPVSWNLPHGVPGDEGLKLAAFSQLRTIADSYSIARACIQTRIQEIVGLEWSIVPTAEAEKAMRGDKGARKDFDERRAKLEKFFRRPDPGKYHNFNSWLAALLEDIFVVDALSLYLQPSRTKGKGVLGSNLAALCLIAGDLVRPMLDTHGGIPQPPNVAFQIYQYGVPRVDLMTAIAGTDLADMAGTEVARYRGDQLLYLPYVARSWTPYGFPPIERALVPILSGIQRQQWQLAYYSEGSSPGIFLSAGDPNATPNQLRELQDAINAMAGDPAWKHKIIVLPQGSKIDPMRPTPLADQFDEMIATQVCMAFDVQPMELGLQPKASSSMGSSNQMARQAESVNERKALKPLLTWLKASVFDFIIQEVCGQPDIQWMWEGLEKDEDEQTQVNLLVNEVGHGLRSIDEARIARGEQAWGLPITSVPVYFTGTGVTPIGSVDAETGHQPPPPAPPGAPQLPPGPNGKQPPQPGGPKPAPSGPNGKPAGGGQKPASDTPAHTGAQAHESTAAKETDNSAQAQTSAKPKPKQAPTAAEKSMAVAEPPIAAHAALRELDLIRRRLNKGRGLGDWTPEHIPADVFADLAADLDVEKARAAVKSLARRQRRTEATGHVEQRVKDGLHDLALGLGDGSVSTAGFVDHGVALLRNAIRDGLAAGVDHAQADGPAVALKQAGIGPTFVNNMDGRFGLYAGQVPQAYEQGYGLATIGQADDPDNIAVRWNAKPGACTLCDGRNGTIFTVGTLPGWPGDGGFGKGALICEGGPHCRCTLEYLHLPVPSTGPAPATSADPHLRSVVESMKSGDPATVGAALDVIANVKAEAQRPYLMGLLQDVLAAITRGAAALREWLAGDSGASVAKGWFNRDEPRDEHGRWSLVGAAVNAITHAAGKLNRGEHLDPDNPHEAQLQDGINSWVNDSAALGAEIRHVIQADPQSPSATGAFVRAVATAPADAPTLYRGIHSMPIKDIPKQGKTFDLAPTAFSRDAQVAEQFALGTIGYGNLGGWTRKPPAEGSARVHITVVPGSRALRIDHASGDMGWGAEHVALGRYKVVSRKETKTVERFSNAMGAKPQPVTTVHLTLEQVA